MTRKLIIYLFITALCLFAACRNDVNQETNGSNEIIHPTAANFIPEDSVTSIIDDTHPGELPDFDDELEKIEIGVAQGDANYMFGRIGAISMVSDSEMVIMDEQADKLRLFNMVTGEYMMSFSSAGRGPGEVMHASDMTSTERTVFLSDRMQKVEIFKNVGLENSSTETLPLDINPHQMCQLNGVLYISGVDHENLKTVHMYDITELEHKTSFHDVYQSDSYLARTLLSNNRIVCNEESNIVVLINPNLPYIYGYSARGEIKWISKLKNFNVIDITETRSDGGRPSLNRSIRPNGVSDIYSNAIAMESTEFVILQMNRLNREGGETVDGKILTFLINSKTGQGRLISEELPFIRAANKDRLISVTNDPFPKITITSNYIKK